MTFMMAVILVGVILIDAKLWKIVLEQSRHNKVVETLLQETRSGAQG